MKQLATTVVQVDEELKNGTIKKVPAHRIIIRGEDTEYSAEAVKFKPIEIRNKLISWEDGKKVSNETVLFDGVRKDQRIPDRLGGNACGRSFPAWEGVKEFPKERQQAEKKKAEWYTMIFGEVTFPGKAPFVAALRITGGQSREWGAVEKMLGKRSEWPSTLLEVKAVGRQGKEHLATPEYRIVQSGLAIEGLEALKDEIAAYITRHNDYIVDNAGDTTEDAPF